MATPITVHGSWNGRIRWWRPFHAGPVGQPGGQAEHAGHAPSDAHERAVGPDDETDVPSVAP